MLSVLDLEKCLVEGVSACEPRESRGGRWGTRRRAVRSGSPVCLPDRAAEAFAGGGEIVFEFADAAVGVAGFGGAGAAFGGELAGGGFEAGDAGGQLGPLGSFDLGAELEAEPGAELVPFGTEP